MIITTTQVSNDSLMNAVRRQSPVGLQFDDFFTPADWLTDWRLYAEAELTQAAGAVCLSCC